MRVPAADDRIRIDRRTFLVAGAVLVVSCSQGSSTNDQPRAGTPGRNVPAPSGVVRTTWGRDPFALGAYSFLAVGATPTMREWLAEPIADRVFFAGEATDGASPSTVHGALASGRRAADQVRAVAGRSDSVAVIGAGAAGAQAARRLRDAGFAVTVFEARDRVGGRLHTVQPAGWPIPIERGASWVHDTDASDLAGVLRRLGIATTPFDYEHRALGRDGAALRDPDEYVEDAVAAMERAIEWADERDPDRSIAEALRESGAAASVDPVALRHLLASEVVTELAADATEISAHWGFEEGTEGDDLLVVGGYGYLVDALLDGIDVRLSSPLRRIGYGGARVDLTIEGGNASFDRVIVTVPLGVLKSGTVAFDPPLPQRHRRAIDGIGFGLIDKLWLRFDSRFWSDDALMWTIVDDDGFAEWFNLAPVTGEPVLLSIVGGSRARELQELSDEQAVARAIRSLQKLVDAGW